MQYLLNLFSKKHLPGWILSLGLLLCYVPILFFEFGFSDDYFGLWEQKGNPNWTSSALEQGRPLQGWVIRIIFGWAHTVAGLSKIRFLALLVLICTAHGFTYCLRQFMGLKAMPSSVMVLGCFCFPAFQVLVLWPSTFPALLSLFMALISGVIVYNTLINNIRLWGILIGLIGLMLVLFTYQIAAGAFLVPLICGAFGSKGRLPSGVLAKLLYVLFGFLIVHLGYFLWFRWYQTAQNLFVGRAKITSDWLGKIEWFFNEPMQIAVKGNSVWFGNNIQILIMYLMLGLILTALVRFISMDVRRNSLIAFGFILCLPIAYAAGIFAEEKFASFRTQGALVMSICCGWALFFKLYESKRIQPYFMVAWLFLGCISIWSGAYRSFVFVQVKDWQEVKAKTILLSSVNDVEPKPSSVTKYADTDKRIQIKSDEFGMPGSSVRWAVVQMYKLGFEQNYPSKQIMD